MLGDTTMDEATVTVGQRGEIVVPEEMLNATDIDPPVRIELANIDDGILIKSPTAHDESTETDDEDHSTEAVEDTDDRTNADSNKNQPEDNGQLDEPESHLPEDTQNDLDKAIEAAGLGEEDNESESTEQDQSEAMFPEFDEETDENAAAALGFVGSEYESDIESDPES